MIIHTGPRVRSDDLPSRSILTSVAALDEILQATLPAELLEASPTSFTITGHLGSPFSLFGLGGPDAHTIDTAHFNLREEYLPWKHLIGKIVLDVRAYSSRLKASDQFQRQKNRNLRTVVNKLDNIDNEFRFFRMEVLAGDPDFVVDLVCAPCSAVSHPRHCGMEISGTSCLVQLLLQSESNCRFRFDFSQVYWNSRLHSEHERLVKLFEPSDVVADVFAGVGPFAIPAAKKGCAVFGNDLNPNSAMYMQSNAIDNRVCTLGLIYVSHLLHVVSRLNPEFVSRALMGASLSATWRSIHGILRFLRLPGP